MMLSYWFDWQPALTIVQPTTFKRWRRQGWRLVWKTPATPGRPPIPPDVQALIRSADANDVDVALLKAIEEVNFRQKEVLFQKIDRYFDGKLEGKTFALWGLSFKPNTDDMRESPSRVLMESLWQAGAKVQAYDPEAMEECQRIYGQRNDLTLVGTAETALKNADALVCVTEWQQFRAPNFDQIKSSLNFPVIFDGRNMYDPKRLEEKGITYISIGRAQG